MIMDFLKGTIGYKLVRHFYPALDEHYLGDTFDYPEVIKGRFDKDAEPIYVVKNAKGKVTVSKTDKFGEVLLSNDEIRQMIKDEVFGKERPKLSEWMAAINNMVANK